MSKRAEKEEVGARPRRELRGGSSSRRTVTRNEDCHASPILYGRQRRNPEISRRTTQLPMSERRSESRPSLGLAFLTRCREPLPSPTVPRPTMVSAHAPKRSHEAIGLELWTEQERCSAIRRSNGSIASFNLCAPWDAAGARLNLSPCCNAQLRHACSPRQCRFI